jgi:hypothetical protein
VIGIAVALILLALILYFIWWFFRAPRVSEQVKAHFSASVNKSKVKADPKKTEPTATPVATTATTTITTSTNAVSNPPSVDPVTMLYAHSQAVLTPARPNGTNGWYVSAPSVSLVPTDGRRLFYRWTTDGAWVRYSSPMKVGDGKRYLEFYSRQPDGIVESHRTVGVNVDTVAPSAPTGLHVVDNTADGISLDWTPADDSMSGVLHYEVFTTDGVWRVSPRTADAMVGKLASGVDYTFMVRAVDAAGNKSAFGSAVRVRSFTPDTAPPVTTLSTKPSAPDGNNGWFVTSPSIALSSSEPGVTHYAWDGQVGYSAYAGSLGTPEGTHTLRYFSTDVAENSETELSATLRVDTTPPPAPALSAAASGTTEIDLSWAPVTDASSGLAAYEVWDDGSGASSFVATVSATNYAATGLSDLAGHAFRVAAVDLAGNRSMSGAPTLASATLRSPIRLQRPAPGSANLAFGSQTAGLISTTLASPPAPPAGLMAIPGTSFDITPGTPPSNPVTVVLTYDPALVQGAPSAIRMMHYTGGQWVDVTAEVDVAGHQVSGTADSFSPFGLFEADPDAAPVVSTPASSWQSLLLLALGMLATAIALRRRDSIAR